MFFESSNLWRYFVCIFIAGFFVTTAAAEDVTYNKLKIIEALKTIRTRSLTPPPKPDTSQKLILSALETRGLKPIDTDRQEISDAYELTQRFNYPRLDFEIKFEFGSSEINEQSKRQLLELSTALMSDELSDKKFVLVGHTDAKGDEAYNLKLSIERANSVLNFLKTHNLKRYDQLYSVGLGESKLKNDGDPHADENRRVEIINLGTLEAASGGSK